MAYLSRMRQTPEHLHDKSMIQDGPAIEVAGQAEDVLDWDLSVPNMPPRSSGKIRVRLVFAGRSKPLNFETRSD